MACVNDIAFAIEPLDDGRQSVRSVLPVVDGVSLADLVEEFERSWGYEPAGGYGGLVPEFYSFGPLDDYYLGGGEYRGGPRRPLLGCSCGEWGCWPLMVTIEASEGVVRWRDLAQPHREERDYAGLGPFQFDRVDYERAVSGVMSELAS